LLSKKSAENKEDGLSKRQKQKGLCTGQFLFNLVLKQELKQAPKMVTKPHQFLVQIHQNTPALSMFSPDKTWYDNHAKRNSYLQRILNWQIGLFGICTIMRKACMICMMKEHMGNKTRRNYFF